MEIIAAPRTKTVETEYTYIIPENISPDQAREIALTRARAQAIADEFGYSVTQTNKLYLENSDEKSETDFFSLGGSELKGEWLEDISSPKYEYITDGGNIALRVKIKGKIREIESSRVTIDVKILRNGISSADVSDNFVSGDDLYMTVNSPVAGYLAVYLIGKDKDAYCLLPYQSQPEGIFQIKANQNYILFNKDYSYDLKKDIVDAITVDTESDSERNRILVLFSPKKFYKGVDESLNSERPRSMSGEKFIKWLSNLRKKDQELAISEFVIKISKN